MYVYLVIIGFFFYMLIANFAYDHIRLLSIIHFQYCFEFTFPIVMHTYDFAKSILQ